MTPNEQACRLYLYGELAKFESLVWAEKLVRERHEQDRTVVGLAGAGHVLSARFKDQRLVDGFVDALDGDAALALAVFLTA